MSEEINVEFNLPSDFLEKLNQANAKMSEMVGIAADQVKESQKHNEEIVKQLRNTNALDNAFKKFDRQQKVAKDVAASYAKIMDSKSADKMAESFEKVNKASGKTLQTFEEIEAEAKILQKAILDTSGNLEEQARLIQEFANKLSPEQQIAFFAGASEAVDQLNGDFSGLDESVKRPYAKLRQLREELINMSETDPRFNELTAEAAELSSRVGDVRDRVKNLASDSKNLNALVSTVEGLTGAFAVGQGAIALFGDENEALQESLLKVQSVMAVLNGLQAVQSTFLEESAAKSLLYANAQKVVAFATGSASAATNVLRTALVATGIGALVVAVGLLAANWEDVTDAIQGTNAQQRLNAEIQREAIKNYAAEKVELDQLVKRYKENSENLEGRKVIIEQLQKLNPDYFRGLNAEKTTYDQLKGSVDRYVASLKNKAVQEAGLTKLTEVETKRLEVEQKKLEFIEKELGTLNRVVGSTGNFKREESFIRDRKRFFDDQLKELDQESAKIQSIIDRNQVPLDFFTDPEKENGSGKSDKKVVDETARLAAEQLAKLNEFYSELINLQNAYEEKRRASLVGEDLILEQSSLNDELISLQEQQLKAELDGLQISEAEKKALIENIDNAIAGLRAENIRETNAQLAELRKEETAKQREQLLQSLDEEQELKRNALERDINQQKNDFKSVEEFEEYKSSRLLQFDIELLNRRIRVLKEQGNEADKVLISQLETTLSNLQLELDSKKPKDKNFLQELFGLDDKSFADTRQVLSGVVSDSIALINQITEARIQASQRIIDQLDEQISAQESAVNQEKELQEKGLANSVESSQAALEELKKQRESAIAEQEKLRKRQATIEALQQAGALVTSATQMFASQAPKGLVGVALAIGAISTIFAYIQKVKADAAKTTIKARRGLVGDNLKVITGRSHEQGGERLLDHVEVESKEMVGVLSRKATSKYGDDFKKMVMAMNSGSYAEVNQSARIDKIEGFKFTPENLYALRKGVEAQKMNHPSYEMLSELSNLRTLVNEVKSLKSDISYMKSEMQNWPKTYTDETGAIVTKMGSKTIRRKKKS
jgi:hypothetical protein